MLEVVFLRKPAEIDEMPRASDKPPDFIVTEDENLIGTGTKARLNVVKVGELSSKSGSTLIGLAAGLASDGQHVLIATTNAVLFCQHALPFEDCCGRLRIHLCMRRGESFAVTIKDRKLINFK